MSKHTPGPWPWKYTSDGKRIVIGEGLVEGPNGYEVAEVYSDDCPAEIAEANARLISAAPELLEQCKLFERCLVYEIAGSERKGDDEGARLKGLTLAMLRAAIAAAEGAAP